MSLDSVDVLLSSGAKYRKEWHNLLLCIDNNCLEKLQNLAFNGDLKVSKFRSICWAILLRVLSSNPNDWIQQRYQQRQRYTKLNNEFSINPHTETIVNDDPLSQSEESVWNQYFDDQNLLTAIKQDVQRTFPGVEFFRKADIQKSMTNILFYYAREHPYMCYRQGMHEILAPILFVIFYDQQSLLHFIEISESIDNLLLDVLNPDYFESDSYFLFSRIMSSIESYYKITNFKPTPDGYFPMQSKINNEETSATTEVVIIGQLNLIRDKILAKEDEHLHNHLLKLDIQMHIFGIRWLRVLFGREFPFLDLLMIWDAIFADSDRFELPNYIVVAMLIRIRDKLLLSDYTTCLMHLMKYPSIADVGIILRHALHLQMPKKFERPANTFIYLTMQSDNMKKPSNLLRNSKNQTITLSRQKSLNETASNHNLSKQRKNSFEAIHKTPSSHSNAEYKTNYQSEVLTNTTTNYQHSKITEIQYKNAKNSARLQQIKAAPNAGDNVIIDGLSEDSPEYLQLELQNAQTIITVSQLKLNKYLSTLRKYITRKCPEDLNQALDGIEELVAFLDVKFSIPSTEIPRVDAASEAISDPLSSLVYLDIAAEENASSSSTSSLHKIKPTQKIRKNQHQMSEAEVKTEFVKILEANKSNPFEVEVDKDGNTLAFKTNAIPEHNYTNISMGMAASPSTIFTNKSTGTTRYEIPDDGFMKNSLRVLGTRMNVELTLFKEEHTEDNEGIPIPDPLGARN